MATIRTKRAPDWGAGIALSFILALVGCALVGCTANHPQDADQLREKTAETTAELKRNAKSVAEGVREGWSRDSKRVDVNRATDEELMTTGLSHAQSERVIAHRPYSSTRELVTKRVLTEDEYRQIEPRVKAGDPPAN
jgi:DNA uptake protein ComE-like DNA-binding protein